MTSTLNSVDQRVRLASGESPPGDSLVMDCVVLEQVALQGWRACDDRLPPEHPRRLLGFVEQRDGIFEVMQLGTGFVWSTFESLEEAMRHVVRSAPALIEERLAGELNWIG